MPASIAVTGVEKGRWFLGWIIVGWLWPGLAARRDPKVFVRKRKLAGAIHPSVAAPQLRERRIRPSGCF